jgi:NADPH:quinone reductase-like Zn-dependent oxidoreductase
MGRLQEGAGTLMVAAQGVFKPVVDQRFPFARIVDAYRVVDSGRKRGSVVVTLDPRAATR